MDVREVNKRVVEQFRAGGDVDGMHRERLVLLTTTGRRTGRRRTVPLLYLPHRDGQMAVVASRGGMSHDPAWYLNLQADPRATVEVGATRRSVVARPATDAERDELWPALVAAYPHFAAYQLRTPRVIPVVILTDGGSPPTSRR